MSEVDELTVIEHYKKRALDAEKKLKKVCRYYDTLEECIRNKFALACTNKSCFAFKYRISKQQYDMMENKKIQLKKKWKKFKNLSPLEISLNSKIVYELDKMIEEL